METNYIDFEQRVRRRNICYSIKRVIRFHKNANLAAIELFVAQFVVDSCSRYVL